MARRADGDSDTIMAREVARVASASIRPPSPDFNWLRRLPMPWSLSAWPRNQAVVDAAAPAAVATTTKLMMVLATTPVFIIPPPYPFSLILMDARGKRKAF